MKEFNWDAFNKSLERSANICSGAKADIERAIKAGKGEADDPVEGEIYATGDDVYIVATVGPRTMRLINLRYGTRWSDGSIFGSDRDLFTRQARTLPEYLRATGGKL